MAGIAEYDHEKSKRPAIETCPVLLATPGQVMYLSQFPRIGIYGVEVVEGNQEISERFNSQKVLPTIPEGGEKLYVLLSEEPEEISGIMGNLKWWIRYSQLASYTYEGYLPPIIVNKEHYVFGSAAISNNIHDLELDLEKIYKKLEKGKIPINIIHRCFEYRA
ncbi:MAG: hypothetical protein ACP5E4_04250, partial [Candidatus Aenigmatarchaeota archaeon]